MASIVKANSTLSQGGLAVLRRSFTTSDEGVCNYEAEYCCLQAFTSIHLIKFRTGAEPPTSIPQSMTLLRLASVPKLYDFNTRTENGLTYFSAKYAAASADAGEVTTTESYEQRSFSAQVIGTVRGNFTGIGEDQSGSITAEVPISFDYVSKTVRVEAKNPKILPKVKGSVGRPFNFTIGKINGLQPQILGQYGESTVDGSSITRSSNGLYTYSQTSSGIYVAAA